MFPVRRSLLGAALALASACTESPDQLVASAVPDDGQWARVIVDGQVRRVHYEVVDGQAIVDGDIGLGPVARLSSFAATPIELGTRWTNAVIRFRLDPSLSNTNRNNIATVHAEYERLTPLRFVDVTANPTGNYVTYYQTPAPDGGGAVAFGVGMQGGEQSVDLHGGAVSVMTLRHEVGHVAGFYHEQRRPDADLWVVRRWDCIAGSYEDQFETEPDSTPLSPYDFGSYMHYQTGLRCPIPTPAGCTLPFDKDDDGVDEMYCDTMHRKEGGAPIFKTGLMTRWDLGALWRMYGPQLGLDEAGDRFGQAVAVGDFDGDGFDDVAVGAPGEDDGAGVVFVFRGTSSRLVAWKLLRASQAQGTNQSGAEFGAALAAGDVDYDAVDDLLVGAPGEDIRVGGALNIDTGAAYLYRGDPGGPTGWRRLTQATAGLSAEQTGDRFGTAVAIAALAAGSKAEGWQRALLIGAPSDAVTTLGNTVRSGAVFVHANRRDPAVLVDAWVANRLTSSLAAGARFGAAITTGDLDGGALDDVAIGAPGAGAGAVALYAGRRPLAGEGPSAPITTYRQLLAAPTGAAGFGSAIAIGQARGDLDGRNELLVGAPESARTAGAAYLFESTASSLAPGTVVLSQTFTQAAPAIVEGGDRFGAAVALADVEPATAHADPIIGAPGEDAGQGVVQVWRGGSGAATYARMLLDHQAGPGVNEAGDHFGAALASGDLNGPAEMWSSDEWGVPGYTFADLVIGHDGEAPDYFVEPEGPAGAGAISVFRGDGAGLIGSLSYSERFRVHE